MLSHWPLVVVQLSGHAPPLHPESRVANVARPKLTSPEKACTVLRSAHLASFIRVGSMPHELGVALVGQEPSSGAPQPAVAGFVQQIMLPEVSTASMKYGFAGAGQSAGLVDRQAFASCASASGAASSAIAAAPLTRSAAPRVVIQRPARRELRPLVQSPQACFNHSFITKPP